MFAVLDGEIQGSLHLTKTWPSSARIFHVLDTHLYSTFWISCYLNNFLLFLKQENCILCVIIIKIVINSPLMQLVMCEILAFLFLGSSSNRHLIPQLKFFMRRYIFKDPNLMHIFPFCSRNLNDKILKKTRRLNINSC